MQSFRLIMHMQIIIYLFSFDAYMSIFESMLISILLLGLMLGWIFRLMSLMLSDRSGGLDNHPGPRKEVEAILSIRSKRSIIPNANDAMRSARLF